MKRLAVFILGAGLAAGLGSGWDVDALCVSTEDLL